MSKISEAILKVAEEIGFVAKNGKAAFGQVNYMFQSWEDVLPAVKAACINQKLTIAPSITGENHHVVSYENKYGLQQVAKVSVYMEFVFLCGDEREVFHWIGESLDTDDKAVQKAGTSGTKYFFIKTFQILVAGETDPDAEKGTPTPDPRTKKEPAKTRDPGPVPPHRQILLGWNATEQEITAVINFCNSRQTKASLMVPEAVEAGAKSLEQFYAYMDGDSGPKDIEQA